MNAIEVETYSSNSTIRLDRFVESWLHNPNMLHTQTLGYHDPFQFIEMVAVWSGIPVRSTACWLNMSQLASNTRTIREVRCCNTRTTSHQCDVFRTDDHYIPVSAFRIRRGTALSSSVASLHTNAFRPHGHSSIQYHLMVSNTPSSAAREWSVSFSIGWSRRYALPFHRAYHK